MAGIACTLSVGNKILQKFILSKCNKNKKQIERDQQTVKSFDKVYKKYLQGSVIDKNEMEVYVNLFTKNLEETKNESSL